MVERYLILGRPYKVLTCPHELTGQRGNRVDALIDHGDAVIWLSRDADPARLPEMKKAVLRRAQREAEEALLPVL